MMALPATFTVCFRVRDSLIPPRQGLTRANYVGEGLRHLPTEANPVLGKRNIDTRANVEMS